MTMTITDERIYEVSADKIRQYRTTETDCRCPSRQYRGGECKHMAALNAALALVNAAGLVTTDTAPKTPVCVSCGDFILNPDPETKRRGEGWCAGCAYQAHPDAGGAPLRRY